MMEQNVRIKGRTRTDAQSIDPPKYISSEITFDEKKAGNRSFFQGRESLHHNA
jgi:hypothetical protein